MVAFQNPITDQGRVRPNSSSSTASVSPNPPADSACAASTRSAAMVNATSAANSIRRPTISLSGPLVNDKSLTEIPDTRRNFHIPPPHTGYTRPWVI